MASPYVSFQTKDQRQTDISGPTLLKMHIIRLHQQTHAGQLSLIHIAGREQHNSHLTAESATNRSMNGTLRIAQVHIYSTVCTYSTIYLCE